MPMIREALVVTRRADGGAHLAPMGAQAVTLPDGSEGVLLQPFRPSATLMAESPRRRWFGTSR